MTKLPDYHLQTEFRIEPPSGRSRSFRIRYKSPDTDNKWTALKTDEIDLANKAFTAKKNPASEELTVAKLKDILAKQYAHRDRKKKKAPFMKGNLALVDKMWAEKYNRRKLRGMKRPESSKHDLVKAAEACGMFPLDTCDLDELADYLDENFAKTPNRLARRITWINSILQWLGRNKLQATNRVQGKVCYLNADEFTQILPHIRSEQDRMLARIAFYTGARIGEIYFIQERHVRASTVFLELQMADTQKVKGVFDEITLKNGLSREIFLYKGVKADVTKWSKFTFAERYKTRKRAFSKIIARACIKAFGSEDPVKILTFHDLRHCHAIWLLQAGATITEVAQQLGNSPEVCYRYYSGFELKKESVERLKRLVD